MSSHFRCQPGAVQGNHCPATPIAFHPNPSIAAGVSSCCQHHLCPHLGVAYQAGPRVEASDPHDVSTTKDLLDRILNLETSAAALQSEKRVSWDIIQALVQCITRLSDSAATSSERSRRTITKLKHHLQETEHENRRLRSQKKAVSSLLRSAARCPLNPVQPQSSEVRRQANNEDLLLCQDITLHDPLKEVSGDDSNPGLSTNSSSTDLTSCHPSGNFLVDHDKGYKHNFLPLVESSDRRVIDLQKSTQQWSQPDLESPRKRFEYVRYFGNSGSGNWAGGCSTRDDGVKNGFSIPALRPGEEKSSSGIRPVPGLLGDSDHCPNKEKPGEIWSSDADRLAAIKINTRDAGTSDLRFPDFFRYGIRFTPNHNESSVFRTVLFENLPVDVTSKVLLESVRGGMILSCRMLNTITITGSKSAMVTFLRAFPATAYVEHVRRFPLKLGGQIARVTLISTPTWPLAINLSKAIFDHGHTRCLLIHDFPSKVSETALRRDLRAHPALDIDMIEHMELRQDRTMYLRFTSIADAGKAFGRFTSMFCYRDLKVEFDRDPCSFPLKTLTMETEGLLQ
ncbi:MAG: hypothetical protein M1837_007119 [Sclerophora amabilis]|nr:MAG: hypothetical protein M1837_007119 [Sclerophora amabilis]